MGQRTHFLLSILAAICLAQPLTCIAQTGAAGLIADNRLPTEICGKLYSFSDWGPPGYGENKDTDSKFTAWIIHLKKPVSISLYMNLGESQSREEISEIEVRIGGVNDIKTYKKLARKLKQLNNKRIIASGILWSRSAPTEERDAVLQMNQIEAADSRKTCTVKQGKN